MFRLIMGNYDDRRHDPCPDRHCCCDDRRHCCCDDRRHCCCDDRKHDPCPDRHCCYDDSPCYYYLVKFTKIDVTSINKIENKGEIALVLHANSEHKNIPKSSMCNKPGDNLLDKDFTIPFSTSGCNAITLKIERFVDLEYLDGVDNTVCDPSNGQVVQLISDDFVATASIYIKPCTDMILKTSSIISHMKTKIKDPKISDVTLLNQFQKIYHNTITSVNSEYATLHGLPIPNDVLHE